MGLKVVLFDLDGTLLPMDQDIFVKCYMGALAKKLAPHGYEPQKLVKSVWAGTEAMIRNDGSKSNEAAFWECFTSIHGKEALGDLPLFDEFYEREFGEVKLSCGYNPKAAEAVAEIKSLGLTVALATNPIFPAVATRQRIEWAGLDVSDFAFYTTYENSCRCKPSLGYYRDVITALGVLPEECLMVGNDVGDDMVAKKLGAKVFLMSDCLINKVGEDISVYPQGGFDGLLEYVKELI